jgi:hypothetical protein
VATDTGVSSTAGVPITAISNSSMSPEQFLITTETGITATQYVNIDKLQASGNNGDILTVNNGNIVSSSSIPITSLSNGAEPSGKYLVTSETGVQTTARIPITSLISEGNEGDVLTVDNSGNVISSPATARSALFCMSALKTDKNRVMLDDNNMVMFDMNFTIPAIPRAELFGLLNGIPNQDGVTSWNKNYITGVKYHQYTFQYDYFYKINSTDNITFQYGYEYISDIPAGVQWWINEEYEIREGSLSGIQSINFTNDYYGYTKDFTVVKGQPFDFRLNAPYNGFKIDNTTFSFASLKESTDKFPGIDSEITFTMNEDNGIYSGYIDSDIQGNVLITNIDRNLGDGVSYVIITSCTATNALDPEPPIPPRPVTPIDGLTGFRIMTSGIYYIYTLTQSDIEKPGTYIFLVNGENINGFPDTSLTKLYVPSIGGIVYNTPIEGYMYLEKDDIINIQGIAIDGEVGLLLNAKIMGFLVQAL